jgi:DNA-binding NtrC family response regulator
LGKEALRLELPDSWNLEDFASLNELKQANARTQGKIIVSDLNVLDAGPEQVLSYLAEIRLRSDVIIFSGDEKWVRQLQGTDNAYVFDKAQFDAMENLLKTLAIVVKKHEQAQTETLND